MSIFFKARGSASFGLLLIRLVIGGIFLIAGAHKALNVEDFIAFVRGMGTIPPNLAFYLGFILPFTEILFGAFFIIGFFTPLTSLILSIMIVSFVIVLPEPAQQARYSIPQISFYLVMLACTLTTLFSGAGVISFDALLDKKKKKEIPNTITPIPPPSDTIYAEKTVTNEAQFEEIKTDNTPS